MMTPQEIVAIVSVARRAPLANMAEAEAVSQLLQKLAMEYAPKLEDVPKQPSKKRARKVDAAPVPPAKDSPA